MRDFLLFEAQKLSVEFIHYTTVKIFVTKKKTDEWFNLNL